MLLTRYTFIYVNLYACCALLVGCASSGTLSSPYSYVAPDAMTPATGPIETQDIISCADELARDLKATPEVAAAVPHCRIALRRIENKSHFRLDTDIITSEMRHHLMRYCQNSIRFVERTRGGEAAEFSTDVLVERELKDEGLVDSAPRKPLAGVDFFLKGEIRSHSVVASQGSDHAIWYYCWLVDTDSGILIWEHRYGPIRKFSGTGTAYRSGR